MRKVIHSKCSAARVRVTALSGPTLPFKVLAVCYPRESAGFPPAPPFRICGQLSHNHKRQSKDLSFSGLEGISTGKTNKIHHLFLLVIDPRASHMLDKHSTTKLQP